MLGGIIMGKEFLSEEELKIGMHCSPDQLKHIYDKYMIIVYDNIDDEEGTLVFLGKKQNKEYAKWFMQTHPITPIFHSSMELRQNVVYDEEELLCY